jgi:hypothetical protein
MESCNVQLSGFFQHPLHRQKVANREATELRDVKNADRSHDVYENTGSHDKLSDEKADIYGNLTRMVRTKTTFCGQTAVDSRAETLGRARIATVAAPRGGACCNFYVAHPATSVARCRSVHASPRVAIGIYPDTAGTRLSRRAGCNRNSVQAFRRARLPVLEHFAQNCRMLLASGRSHSKASLPEEFARGANNVGNHSYGKNL